ncbi:SAM-dependent methyltransferase [Heliobacillus mobilis]|uniref:SAM-dependent methyltransferase n=1 Tax=Heliobacterium mobile TaxID=28064 RepID=A0A6I3SP65_HELMO|nr:SAM-dependent methyltransferase [Heliobacterium mobile]MTV50834.1 SAM-dependent methyltransferase [Heliobacterium mobile]
MSMTEGKLDISCIVFIGRTFDEYMRMFNLTKEELLGKKILDCPAGACSFTSTANQLGLDVTAADIAYYYDCEQLLEKGSQDLELAMKSMEKVKDNYLWDYFKSISELKKQRTMAYSECIRDMEQSPNRYVPAVLPNLPFGDKLFDITLSAHFLFMYADRLDYKFHLQTIQELIRITKQEVRIFPLVDLSCKRYQHLDDLMDLLTQRGYKLEEAEVPYEFHKGANSLLKIKLFEDF